jgi:prolipoprotein diacylglyceryltransferase
MIGIFFGLVWLGVSWFTADHCCQVWKLNKDQFHLLRLILIMFCVLGAITTFVLFSTRGLP